LKTLKDQGWVVAIVEKWNPHVKVRQDLFGFADLLAIREGEIAAIQVTAAAVAARVTKIKAEPKAKTWLRAGGKIYVHGWRKLKKRKKDGGYSKVAKYAMRDVEVTLDDFEDSP
nr:hypothetical protein [Anaerolineae bacterium]NIN98191.1 hypothetical protein [Anaerolineae bacterium]NIQ81115.1 hypothetical protein [Anaerolineae bacterium]